MLSVWTTKVEGYGDAIDRDQARRALGLLLTPGERHEIRCLPGARSRVVTADDLDAAVEAVRDLRGTHYYSLNPIATTAERASKGSVVRRAWFLLDVDPERPADVSATEAEKAKAAEVVTAVVDFLLSLGWPAPLIVDSGNGWHMLYKVDLPNDKISHSLLKACVYALAERFDTLAARIDKAVHDAARISKLPGTWSRKGPDTADRPHRTARIAYEPASLDVVPLDAIKALATPAKADEPAPEPPADPWATPTTAGSSLAGYVGAAIERECAAVVLAPNGTRNNRLNVAAFNLATMATWPEMDATEARAALARAAIQAGLNEDETRLTIASGWAGGEAAQPRVRPEPTPAEKAGAAAVAATAAGKSPIKYASKITPKRIEFLWPGRIPLGKLTTFAGHGGLGKTFVLCDISARISRGGEWPMSGGECATPGDVLFISGEDDEEDTLVPRLIECEADLERIAFLSDEFADAFTLVNLDVMKQAVQAMRSPRMIVIDPPTNYLEGVDDHKNSELRSRVLRPLSAFARDHKVAIVLNNHVNKSSGKDVEASTRVMGSVAWVNGVRTAYLFVRDSQDPDIRVIAPIKINVGKLPPSITYKIADTRDGLARVEWLSENGQNADQVSQPRSSGATAAEWITNLFRDRRAWPSNEIKQMARECGHTYASVFQSREVAALPIRKTQNVTADGSKYWTWIATDPAWPKLKRESGESGESVDANPLQEKDGSLSRSTEGGAKVRGGGAKVGGGSLSRSGMEGEPLSRGPASPGMERESEPGVAGQGVTGALSPLSPLSRGSGEGPQVIDQFFKPF